MISSGLARRSRHGALCRDAMAASPRLAKPRSAAGTLTYMIPADAPPTLDGHRETTFATCTRRRRSTAC